MSKEYREEYSKRCADLTREGKERKRMLKEGLITQEEYEKRCAEAKEHFKQNYSFNKPVKQEDKPTTPEFIPTLGEDGKLYGPNGEK